MSEIILADESYRIIGACFEVYNTMGCGFLESVYHECLEFELSDQNIPFQSKRELSLHYKNRPLRKKFEADFICFDQVVVEIKACSDLTDDHSAQLLNYLRVSGNSERESTYVIAFRHLTTYDDRPILAVKHVIPLFPGTLRQSNSRTPSITSTQLNSLWESWSTSVVIPNCKASGLSLPSEEANSYSRKFA